MEPKIQALFNELKKVFLKGNVEYRFESELHKFRLERDGPYQWLYVAREFVDDYTVPELLASLSSWKIPDVFRSSSQNRWLFLSEAGIREVNDSFGRGH